MLRLFKIVKKAEALRLKNQEKLKTPIPYSCVLSVTWKCNLHCVGCYANNYPKHNQMNILEIESVISQCCDLGTYIFIVVGGEPLLIPELVETMAKYTNAIFFMFTNGIKLTEEKILELKKAKHIIPIISIEGDADFINYRRGEGMGGSIDATLKRLKKHKIVFGISSMVTHENLHEVLTTEWINKIWTYGAKFGFIIDYIPFPHNMDENLVLTTGDIDFKIEKIEELNEKSNITLFNFPENEYKQKGCKSAGSGFIHVNANGNVEPCPFSHYAVDNIRDKPILEILKSDFFAQLRSEFQHKENEHQTCMLFAHDEKVREIAKATSAFSTENNQKL
jgi:MoaA/NifB/PqqE/SkfB family radical SAM enzyme